MDRKILITSFASIIFKVFYVVRFIQNVLAFVTFLEGKDVYGTVSHLLFDGLAKLIQVPV